MTLLPNPPAFAQAQTAAELGGTLLALQQLRSQLDGVINTVDTATANRIRQLEIAIDGVISQVKDAMDHGYGLINNTRDQVMGNIATILTQGNDIVQSNLGLAFLDVDNSLANAARLVSSLPLIKVPAYVFAVTPIRLQPRQADRLIQVHAFFPDVSSSHPVIVTIEDGSPKGQQFKVEEFVNNVFGFELPVSALASEGRFITFRIAYPIKHALGLYYTTTTVKARIYVEKSKPFSFSIGENVENADLWATVPATRPLTFRADSNLTTNNVTKTAAEVFSTLVNDDTNYDMSTASFVSFNPGNPVTASGPPCASGCNGGSGGWSWDAKTLRVNLSAPTCPAHWISLPFPQIGYQCGGGGTNADFSATPTFRVKRRGAIALESVANSVSLTQARKTASDSLSLPANWTSIAITSSFSDDTQTVKSTVRLTSGSAGILSSNDAFFWSAAVLGDRLVITTR